MATTQADSALRTPATATPRQPHASFHSSDPALGAELSPDLAKLLQELDGQTARADVALRTVAKSLSANATNPHFFFQLGRALQERGRYEHAAQHYQRAIQIQPQFVTGYTALAAIQRAQGNAEAAALTLREGLGVLPRSATLHAELAVVLESQADLVEAERHLRLAVEIDPALAGAWFRLGGILQQQAETAQARGCFAEGVRRQPSDIETQRVRSLIALQLGDFATGWQDFDLRHLDRRQEALAPQVIWDPEVLAKQTVLVRSEGNLCDDLMFVSCLGEFTRLAGRCAIECDLSLAPLLARSFPGVTIVPDEQTQPGAALDLRPDAEIHLGTLPRYLRPTPVSFPAQRGYLRPDAVRTRYWRDRLAAMGAGLKVGISWRAGRAISAGGERDLELSRWEEVLRVPGVRFVSLQRGCGAEVAAAREALHVDINEVLPSGRESIDDQAALIAALDLVITVPSSVAHLSGAVGAATWVPVAAWPSWRWQLAGDACPWYPSLRLFRQARRGDWKEVMQHLAGHLRNAETATCTGK